MATLGSVIIAFSASTGAYLAGSKQVKDDAKGLGETFSGLGETMGGALEAVGIALSVESVVDGLKDHFMEAAKSVTDLARDADKLSTSTKTLSELRFAAKDAGVDAEGLSKAMLKAQENIGKAATEGGEASKTLSQFGFNVKALADLKPDEQFKSIADTISKISNPSQEAAASVAIFGRQGAELKPLLEEGAEGLTAAAAEADKLGIAMSDVDAQNMLRASQAVGKVSDAFEGIENQLIVKLAPYIEIATKKLLAFAENGNLVGKIVSGAMTGIAYTAAGLTEIFIADKAEVELFASGATWALYGIVEAFNGIAKAAAWVSEHVFHHHIDTSELDAAADHLKAKAKELYASSARDFDDAFHGTSAAKTLKFFADVQAQADATSQKAIDAKHVMGAAFAPPDDMGLKKITDLIAGLKKQVDEFGMSEGQKKLAELKDLHASSAQIAQAEGYAKQLDILKQQADVQKQIAELKKQSEQAGLSEAQKKLDDLKRSGANDDQVSQSKKYQEAIDAINAKKTEGRKLDEEAKKIREEALTPLQKQHEKMAELLKLEETGRLSHAEYAAAKARADADRGGEEHHGIAAATRGSQESFKLINEINNRNNKANVQEQLAAKNVKLHEDGNHILKDIHTALKPKPPHLQKIAI